MMPSYGDAGRDASSAAALIKAREIPRFAHSFAESQDVRTLAGQQSAALVRSKRRSNFPLVS